MSGLTTYGRDCFADQPDCRISLNEAIERYGVLFSPPGDHFDYSNLGFGILGEVVARASGKSYGEFLGDEIFRPLGMSHCSLPAASVSEALAAARYDQTTHERSPARQSGTPGASAVQCSVHDLVLFGMFHLKAHLPTQKAILSDASLDVMHSPIASVSDNPGEHYGIGWWINDDFFGYRSLFGSGGTNDATANLQTIPSDGIVVAVVSNTGTTLPQAITEEILAELLPRFRDTRAEREKDQQDQLEKPQSAGPSAWIVSRTQSRRLVGEWSGAIQTYRGSIPLMISISASGEVRAKLGSQPSVALEKASLDDRSLYGLMAGDVGTDDAPRPPYNLEMDLFLRGETLAGAATTRELRSGERGALLPYWVELKKTSN